MSGGWASSTGRQRARRVSSAACWPGGVAGLRGPCWDHQVGVMPHQSDALFGQRSEVRRHEGGRVVDLRVVEPQVVQHHRDDVRGRRLRAASLLAESVGWGVRGRDFKSGGRSAKGGGPEGAPPRTATAWGSSATRRTAQGPGLRWGPVRSRPGGCAGHAHGQGGEEIRRFRAMPKI